jgi:hypothetical protein
MQNRVKVTSIIILGLITFNLSSCEKPAETERTSDHKIVTEKPPFETTAVEIAKAYADNVVTADNKFKDATFNVSGTIVDISKNFIKEPHLSLKGGVDSAKEPQFVFLQSETAKGSELKIGQDVKLQCIGQGDLAEIPMAGECRVLE